MTIYSNTVNSDAIRPLKKKGVPLKFRWGEDGILERMIIEGNFWKMFVN